jgi:hypothetical protein
MGPKPKETEPGHVFQVTDELKLIKLTIDVQTHARLLVHKIV